VVDAETTKGKPLEVHQAIQWLYDNNKLVWDTHQAKWQLRELITQQILAGAVYRPQALHIAALLFESINTEVIARVMASLVPGSNLSVRILLLLIIESSHASCQVGEYMKQVGDVLARAQSLNIISGKDFQFVNTATKQRLVESTSEEEIRVQRRFIIQALNAILDSTKLKIRVSDGLGPEKLDPSTLALMLEMVQQEHRIFVKTRDNIMEAKVLARNCYVVAMNILSRRSERADELLLVRTSNVALLL